MAEIAHFDLVIIGGGINGAGIARDAAGRGLSVLLLEKNDLASATSSASSKLIHGGLRYLEQYEFRLVAEALTEREVLLNIAPHLVHPLQFVMPHVPELRPRWMIRAGLYLYDHLGRRTRLPASHGVNLQTSPLGAGLKPAFAKGFAYADCRVDDTRLVIANALSARQVGARIELHTECLRAGRTPGGWEVEVQNNDGVKRVISARVLVNAAGPWVKEVLNERLHQASEDQVKLVKGSHIVVPRHYDGEHAYILQNDDRRVVFMIPYEQRFTLIGTTDVAMHEDPANPIVTADEVAYLCQAASKYFTQSLEPADVVWSYAGVRPLYDDGTANPSAITRDYTLRLDAEGKEAPVLSVFGGKITTYRRLAEHALEKLKAWFPEMRSAWTATTPLPGGEFESGFEEFTERELMHSYPWLSASLRRALARRHGTITREILHNARCMEDLGVSFGAELFAREIDYLIEHEWARTAEDILFRRTKTGLHLTVQQCEAVADYVAARVPGALLPVR
ncbi:MAG TPA: glycerol-3-phosphate dehydrogenase [Burkholderiales bacterium]|nr:glycerol-3-phosphate dehydrogenase [Burkholderiales bacterium]